MFCSDDPTSPANTPADVESKEREPPRTGDALGSEALAATRDPGDEHPLRIGQTPGLRRVQPGAVTPFEPSLQILEPPNDIEVYIGRNELEDTGFPDRLALLLEDDVNVLTRQFAVVHHGPSKGILGLCEGQADGCLGEAFKVIVRGIDLDPPALAIDLDHPVEQ